MPRELIDLTGKTFGRLTVIERAKMRPGAEAHWRCSCSCGASKVIAGHALRSGKTRSCGCFNKEWARKRFTTHGLRKSRVYSIWAAVLTRCTNPKAINYPIYGGRGITVCPEWESFENFFEDMGHPPDDFSIERRNNNNL